MPQRRDIIAGPWPGGLNELALGYADNMNDDQVPYCKNFEFNNDGTARPRRAWQAIGTKANFAVGTVGLRSLSILGTIKNAGDEWVYICAREATQAEIYCSRNPISGTTWTLVATLAGVNDWPANIVRYNDVVYINRSENVADTGAGGWSFPASTIGAASVLTVVGSIPKGTQMFLFKDRMWVANQAANQILYSKATDPTNWTASATSDAGAYYVSRGDGEALLDVVVANNQLYIFKERKFLRHYYSSDPQIDGTLVTVNDSIGGYAVWYKDRLFVVSYNGLFQVVNDQFYNLSHGKLYDQGIQTLYRPCIIGETLYFQWTGLYNVQGTYAMNVNNGAFSQIDGGIIVDGYMTPLQSRGFYRWSRASFDNPDDKGNGWVVQANENAKELYFVADLEFYTIDKAGDGYCYCPKYEFHTKSIKIGDGFSYGKLRKVFMDGALLPYYKTNSDTCYLTWTLAIEPTESPFEYSGEVVLDSQFFMNRALLHTTVANMYQRGYQYFGGYVHAAMVQLRLKHTMDPTPNSVISALGNQNDQYDYATINRIIFEIIEKDVRNL